MNNLKVIAFTISAILALLVLTNGNGSLLQTAFGDSDSKEDSVDEIIESAEEESNQARDEAEEAEEADTDDEARDRESDDDEDEVDDEDNINNGGSEDNSDDNVRDEFEVDDASSNLDSEIEDEVREVKDNVEEDERDDDTPVLGEGGSGMQIFVSPREIVNEILDQHLDNIEEQLNNPPPTLTPGGVGSPGDGPTVPRLGLTFDEDINNLSPGDGNEGNHIFLLTFH